MKARLQVLLIFTIALLLSNCKDSKRNYFKCTDGNTYKLCQHALDYFYFKKGSWWVYQEETTGQTDSIWVDSDKMEKVSSPSLRSSCGCGYGRCYAEAGVSFYNAYSQGQGTALFAYLIDNGLTSPATIVSEGSRISLLGGYRMEYNDDCQYVTPTNTKGNIETLDSFRVEGKLFHDILHLSYPQQDNIPDWLHEAWYAKNIHLIKFRRYDSTTWNLLRYNIMQ